MNNTELYAKKWLLKNGYKEEEIIFRQNSSPDFICKDGKRFEVKYLYGNKLIFSKKQEDNLKKTDIILVFDKNGLKAQFNWGDKDKTMFEVIVYDTNKGNTTIKASEKLWNFLNQNKQMSESFEDVIWRYIKKKESK